MTEPSGPGSVAGRPPWLRRHSLLWIGSAHHEAVCTQIPDAPLRKTVADWLAAGCPVVVRRQAAELFLSSRIGVGIPLPPSRGKQRVALEITPESIAASAPPPLLSDVISRLARSRRTALSRLVRDADSIGLALRVYGSAAWEALTGRSHLTPQSDIDLWWRPMSRRQLAGGVAMLARWERAGNVRADGEIVFGDDDAVAWREWMQAGARRTDASVLVKTTWGSRLDSARSLLAMLPGRETVEYATVSVCPGGAFQRGAAGREPSVNDC